MNKRTKRLNSILEYLQKNKSADVKELSERLVVSDMTVRRDLKYLEDQDLVRIKHGGVFINQSGDSGSVESDYTLLTANSMRIAEKKRIAVKAVSLIEPGESVTIDSGSTMEEFARILPGGINLSVLCYSLNILNEVVKRGCGQVIFSGGYYHERSMMFESPEGLSLIRRTRTNKAFISASGANADLGVTTKIPQERDVKEAIMESSQSRILLIDSAKFGKVQTNYFANLEDFEIIITDSDLPDEYAEIIRKKNVQLYIV